MKTKEENLPILEPSFFVSTVILLGSNCLSPERLLNLSYMVDLLN